MSRRGERGTTLIEVMLAGAILLVATLAFAATTVTSATATAVAHRRSVASYFRTGLLERYAVTARTNYGSVPAGWLVDACYDKDSKLIAQNGNLPTTPPSTTFTCDARAVYRTWVQVTSLSPSNAGPWTLSVYAERIDPGCAAADRYSSLACVGADLYVTD